MKGPTLAKLSNFDFQQRIRMLMAPCPVIFLLFVLELGEIPVLAVLFAFPDSKRLIFVIIPVVVVLSTLIVIRTAFMIGA